MNQKSTKLPGLVCWLIFFSFLQFTGFAQTWTPRQASVAASDGYYEYLPQGYNDPGNSTKKYPLLIFAHGIGETGNGTTDISKLNNTGLPWLINQGKFPASFNVGGNNYSFIVICPQFKWWPGSTDMEAVMAYVLKNYRVDTTRVYMTGLSMGGGVTWDYAGASTTNASILAAILPIAGAATATTQKCQNMASTNLPVWATHNDNDPTVSVWNTLNFISGINAFNPNPLAQKTIFSSYAHDAWTQTYDPSYKLDGTHNCYEWMLQYTRGAVAPPPPPPAPSPLTVWISNSINISCNKSNNGSATVGVSGGVTPYAYSWNTASVQTGATATSLPPGTYTITVKDAAGTVGTSSVTITQPDPLVLTVTPGTIATSGGTTDVTLAASGGTAPYTYSGSTTTLKAGTYTYTVTDAKGCSDSKTITINEPAPPPPPPTPPSPALAATLSNTTDVRCNGQANGSATISVTGGVTPYTYSWNTTPVQTGATATNLAAGNYTVTVKDAGGSIVTSSVTIGQPAPLELLLTPGTIRLMGGTTNVGVTARGGVGTYSFTGPTVNVGPGTYTYKVVDGNSCENSARLDLKDPGVQLAGFTLNVRDTMIGLQWSTGYEYAIDHFEVEKSLDGQLFQPDGMVVSHGNSQGSTEYQTGDVKTQSGRNYYRLYVVTQYGERKLLAEKSLYYEDRGQVTIKNLADRIDITLTSTKNEIVNLQLLDMNGRTVQTLQVNKQNAGLRTSLSLNGLPRGMYVVKVSTSTMQTAKQVVKP